MSVNLVYLKDGAKMTRPVLSREEYFKLRNTPENAKNFYDARGGNEKAKGDQVQFCYNDLLPNGVLAGCCHPSSTGKEGGDRTAGALGIGQIWVACRLSPTAQ